MQAVIACPFIMQKFVEIPPWLPTGQHRNQGWAAKLRSCIKKKNQQGEMGTRSREGCVYSRKNWEWVGRALRRRTDESVFFCSNVILAWDAPFSKATLRRDTKLSGLEETEPKSCGCFRYLRTTHQRNWECPKWTGIPQVQQSYHGSYQGLCHRMRPRQREQLN